MIDDQLRQAMKASGHSFYALALAAGVRPEMLTRFAAGERDIRLATAAKVAKVLGLSLQAMLEDVPDKAKTPAEMLEELTAARDLMPHYRQTIDRMLEQLAQQSKRGIDAKTRKAHDDFIAALRRVHQAVAVGIAKTRKASR
jgi:transcriptional regulator with XRE-family HTH domain